MPHLGQTLYLWRVENRLTQTDLARRSGISRPNLSTIENGGRDITVETLRRLAAALDITPGVLVDGVLPITRRPETLSRERLDRIARALAVGSQAVDSYEEAIVQILKPLIKRKLGLSNKKVGRHLPRMARGENTALLKTKAVLKPDELKYLLSRIEKILSVPQ